MHPQIIDIDENLQRLVKVRQAAERARATAQALGTPNMIKMMHQCRDTCEDLKQVASELGFASPEGETVWGIHNMFRALADELEYMIKLAKGK